MKSFIDTKYIIRSVVLLVVLLAVGVCKAEDLTVSGNTSLPGEVTYDNVTVDAGATLTVKNTLHVKGNFVVNGTIDVLDGAICMCGSGRQDIVWNGKAVFNRRTVLSDETYNYMYVKDLYIENSSDYKDTSKGVHVSGTNIHITNFLSMNEGVLYLDDENYVILRKGGETSESTLKANNLSSFVDGLLIRLVREKTTCVFPVGNAGQTGFAFVKQRDVVEQLNAERYYGVRYHKGKPQMGNDGSTIYESLGNEYWEFTNCEAEGGATFGKDGLFAAHVEVRVGDANMDYLLQSTGVVSALYYINSNNSTSWDEFDNAAVNVNEGLYTKFGGTVVSSHSNTEGTEVQLKIYQGKPLYVAYGVKKAIVEEVEKGSGGKTVVSVTSDTKMGDGDGTWTGASDADWTNAANWKGGVVPGETEEVLIKDSWSGDLVTTTIHYSDGTDSTIVSYGEVKEIGRFPVIGEGVQVVLPSLTIEGTVASVTVDGGALCVTGAITVGDAMSAGHIVVKNRYDRSSALKYGTTNYSKYQIDRTFLVDRAVYVGSATQEGSVEGFVNLNSGGDRLQVYNVTTGKYQDASSFDRYYAGALKLVGALHGGNSEATIRQIGTPFTEEINPVLRAKEKGWTVLTNPYLFAFNFKDADMVSYGESASPSIWFRRYNPQTGYYWTTYNLSLDEGVVECGTAKAEVEPDYVLAPQQDYYVMTHMDDANNFFVLKPSAVNVSNMLYGQQATLKSAALQTDVLRISMGSDGEWVDETVLAFREGGSVDANYSDSKKMINTGVNYNQIYVVKEDGSQCAISLLPELSVDEQQVRLVVRMSAKSDEATLRFENVENIDANVFATLHDQVTGETIDLRVRNEYTFEAEAGATLEDRFLLSMFKIRSAVTAEDAVAGCRVLVEDGQCRIVLPAEVGDAEAIVWDMAGRLVRRVRLQSGENVIAGEIGGGVVKIVCGEGIISKFVACK